MNQIDKKEFEEFINGKIKSYKLALQDKTNLKNNIDWLEGAIEACDDIRDWTVEKLLH